jgi:hypothetical protein
MVSSIDYSLTEDLTIAVAVKLAIGLVSTVGPAMITAIGLVPAVIGAHGRRPQRDGRKNNFRD